MPEKEFLTGFPETEFDKYMENEDFKREFENMYQKIKGKNYEENDNEKFNIDDLGTFCLIISIEILIIILILLYNI